MAMNKFMHPRNPYRKRPDFKKLAIEFPEFRKYAQQDLSGKIQFNFKDQGAVWALTKCLLKRDFDLNVEMIPDRLVPTLPLRMNYLLWIEDLLAIYKPKSVHGIDIGTGASCIYPLLGAKYFGWNMLGTEIDIASIKCALANVENNYLNEKITVKAVTEDIVLDGALDDETIYDFCVCNPPFFSDSEELKMETKSRTQSRKPPTNAPTGIPSELLTPGGELVFIARIITDSEKLKDRIRIFTAMVGKKSNLKHLKELVREYEDVSSVATTVFCQGRTTRWGIAWTFVPGLDLNNVPHASTKKKALSFAPFSHAMRITDQVTFDSVKAKILTVLSDLKIDTDFEEAEGTIMITLKCFENTWINSRKRRRQEKKNQEKAQQMEVDKDPGNDANSQNITTQSTNRETSPLTNKNSSNDENVNKSETTVKCQDSNESSISYEKDSLPSTTQGACLKRTMEEENTENNKRIKLNTNESVRPEYLVASLILKENDDSTELTIEMYFIEGTGGKDVANQLLTYMKNRLSTL